LEILWVFLTPTLLRLGRRSLIFTAGAHGDAGPERAAAMEGVVMMRYKLQGIAGLSLALGLVACQSGPGDLTSPTPPPVVEAPDGGTSSGGSTASLLGEWQLVTLQETGQAVVTAPAGHHFSADFTSEGRVHMAADCNRCFAEYSAAPGTIEVGLAGCTLAYCATAPLDTTFSGLVTAARQWSVRDEQLTLSSEDGTLTLRR
jgi:heat shock protein HslJ